MYKDQAPGAGIISGIGRVAEREVMIVPNDATVKQDQLELEGKPLLSAEDIEKFRRPIQDKYETEGNPCYSTARLWDDGILDPAETRMVLGLALSVVLNGPIREAKFGVFRM
jgi:3-methylcrotonyl-CoA carboxylase beta subunit